MKFSISFSIFCSIPLLMVSCVTPSPQGGQVGANGTYQDPNNPYAVPGVSTQGGGYAPAAQAPFQAPDVGAPYQPIPSTPINPPATTYTPPVSSSPASGVSAGGGGSHSVVRGDTLWGLSRKYSVSVDDIRSANGLSSDTIIPGQILRIP